MPTVIETHDLRKVYRASGSWSRTATAGARPTPAGGGALSPVHALDGLDLRVGTGELFGLLGPNGAGKTTTIGILTTRVRPTGGRALVAGADVVADPVAVRRRIGVVPQQPNPDRSLTVRENLVFHARYFGFPTADARARADSLLDRFGIADKSDVKPDALSGGQQQRLMIARALIHDPEVIFLDEPTVGLDPQARLDLWLLLRELHGQGRTMILTTHYMEEADRLCDRVAIVDRGRLLAVDTPARLKEQAPGGTLVSLTLDADAAPLAEAAARLDRVSRATAENSTAHVYSDRASELIPALIRLAEERGRAVRDIHLARPSLETLFISMTGRRLGQ